MRHYIQFRLRPNLRDAKGEHIAQQCQTQLQIAVGRVRTARLFTLDYPIETDRVIFYAQSAIQDRATEELSVNTWWQPTDFAQAIVVANLPGVTDDLGRSARLTWSDLFDINRTDSPIIYAQQVYYFERSLSVEHLQLIATKLLGNPLIQHFQYWQQGQTFEPYFPAVQLLQAPSVATIDLKQSDEALLQLSQQKILALNLAEMQAIAAYFELPTVQASRKEVGLSLPTDAELEILAQTWSEHCKHKEFNATIDYRNQETGEQKTIYSLFDTYIKAATEQVKKQLEAKQNYWLVKVFDDNAGVVQATDKHLFVWKVETHNSPSALDPYGGAITGILGNNRDPLATGIGGAILLFNTNVLCFGSPQYNKPLLAGQLHPKQILEGVVKGIADGGNKSGVPTINGAVVFDDRYSGKPLVYCGTGALMPYEYEGKPTWIKEINQGDRIVLLGGRVGKDGIHGATFSSLEIDENSPATAVQIGAPIVQKKLADFMQVACRRGLIQCSTDNGAGGLSSSIGELARLSNGAVVHLEQVPLKYQGLQPWEIFVSESQERMTLAVTPQHLTELRALAESYEVELTDVGYFENTGWLDVRYEEQQVAYLDMQFLHDGVPTKQLVADWQKPKLMPAKIPATLDYNQILLQLLASLNICSREPIIRQYDHEVKGRTILKPLMGKTHQVPQDAGVIRFDFESWAGVAVSNGILPRYGDIDPYAMSAGAFDEGIRQIIAVGGRLPNTQPNDGVFWSVNDNFCVPDSVYHATKNPDGKQKLAKLVKMCEALYDMATYFDIPLTSGKDSMKNDFKSGTTKISIPPTILYSMTAKIDDVRQTITSEWQAAGDLIYQLGDTYDELGASEFYQLYGQLGQQVPQVRPQAAKELYLNVMEANQQRLIQSCHDISDGGLAVAIAESCFGGLGANIQLDSLSATLSCNTLLFAESHSRFVVSIAPADQVAFEAILGNRAYRIGQVTTSPKLVIQQQENTIIDTTVKSIPLQW